MVSKPPSLEKLLSILRSLPGVGPRMSERIAYYLLKLPDEEMQKFLECTQAAYKDVRPCQICGHWDDSTPCQICQDPARDKSVLCVVESSQDIVAISKVKKFDGIYHVLGGILSPLEGVGPQDLQISALLKRLEDEPIKEVILALNSDIEGETTAQYIARQIRQLSKKFESNGRNYTIKLTRPARGLPAGGELEYMDELTLSHAFDGRKEVSLS